MTSHYPCNATLKNEQNVILFDCSFCTQTCLLLTTHIKQGNPTILNHQNSDVHSGSKSIKKSRFYNILMFVPKFHYFFHCSFCHFRRENSKTIFDIRRLFLDFETLWCLSCFFLLWKYVIKIGISILGLKLWSIGWFFFQTPLIRTFPTLLMPLLNSWALGMKKWSKNRACQFRSVRPLKISKPRSVTNLKTKKNSMLLRG